jgi:hypothetical protein
MKLFLLLLPALASAAVWPDTLGSFKRISSRSVALTDPGLWRELGFQDAEQAVYAADDRKFQARAFRFQDSTGAMAAFQWQRPPDAKPSSLGSLAVETAGGVILAHGNYLLAFDGYQPSAEELGSIFQILPKLEQSSLPNLIEQLPIRNLIPNSGRYVVGPEGLVRFEPRIPPATAGFHMGTEAQGGIYRTSAGDLKLAIFLYPTPQIAQQQVREFEKIQGAMVKRTGPLIAVTVAPPDPDEAERILAQVRYEATITWSEYVPTARDNVGDLVVNAFLLTGVLLLFALVSSFAFGGLWAWWRRRRGHQEPEAMIVLHLSDRP